MSVEIRLPQMGESVAEGTVARWVKNVGDAVKQDELLVEIETDKVTMEVNAPTSGTLSEILTSAGDVVEVGALLGRISEGGVQVASESKSEAVNNNTSNSTAKTEKPAEAPKSNNAPIAMPSAQVAAHQNNVNLNDVKGSGKDGRILKEDVLGTGKPQSKTQEPISLVIPQSAPKASVNSSDAPREERVKMTRLRQTVARRLKQAQETAAMLTTFNEIDMTNVMALRSEYKDIFEKKHKTKLGFMSFFVKAVVQALQEIPAVNAEIDGDEIVYKNYYHIGVAVGSPTGLVVPVVKDCQDLSFAQIEKSISNFGVAARDGKLSIADMQGGTFTISNGGVYGSLMSTPIINPPQSAILGMHKIQNRPVVLDDGSIVARPMMYLALSYDHRIIDGKEAVTFLVRIKEGLEDPRRLLLDL